MNKRSFASDNYTGIHPDILNAVAQANQGDCPSYGNDPWTQNAIEKFKDHFGQNIDVYFVYTGTAANVLGLNSILKPYQAVICAETAHINVDECGAPENYLGSKLLTVPTGHGKLTVELIEKFTSVLGNEHHVQPKVISITQATELGTVYSAKEIKKLADFAHKNNWFLHMDGARLSNAAAYLNCSLKEITADVGVDILSFGGTKNGMMVGEAIIFFNKELAKDFKYIRKQGMQLGSKMRFISAQFLALLTNNLWLKNAQHANNMAQLLAQELSDVAEIDIANEIQANAVFARLDKAHIKKLQNKYPFYVWNEETSEVRWMTSFNTTVEDVMEFTKFIKQTIKE